MQGMNWRSLLNLMGFGRSHQRLHEAQLRAMSSRELADLGIGSSQIPAVLLADAPHARDSSRVGTRLRFWARPADAPPMDKGPILTR